ncbi:hypothetical protein [Streptomyces olivoreticuli]|uniref:hypothetical protein n=1 Tax=Streptomyces olivoreticuli TaxID=68246 RepID=UPI000E221333|nr:hypothetical protein [Streptomyces olivoreticuli]
MAEVALNIAIGLVTSVLSGGWVWLWQRGKAARILQRRARFFGLRPGETCIIVMNNRWDLPGSAEHHDVQAMIEAAVLAHQVGCAVSMRSSDEFREGNDNCVEFCIGGPENGSNVRSGGHLAHNLPGVAIRPFSTRRDSMAIVVGGERFLRDRDNQEYALVAKFTPPGASRPVVLTCGQSAIANHAAMYFLTRSYRQLSNLVATTEQFCLVIRVESIGIYGFRGAVLAKDVSAAAFTR